MYHQVQYALKDAMSVGGRIGGGAGGGVQTDSTDRHECNPKLSWHIGKYW